MKIPFRQIAFISNFIATMSFILVSSDSKSRLDLWLIHFFIRISRFWLRLGVLMFFFRLEPGLSLPASGNITLHAVYKLKRTPLSLCEIENSSTKITFLTNPRRRRRLDYTSLYKDTASISRRYQHFEAFVVTSKVQTTRKRPHEGRVHIPGWRRTTPEADPLAGF